MNCIIGVWTSLNLWASHDLDGGFELYENKIRLIREVNIPKLEAILQSITRLLRETLTLSLLFLVC
jgi:hypothetical protein